MMNHRFILESGACIGVCAPSARFDRERFNRGLALLKEKGLHTRVPDQIFEKKRYLAGSDTHRARTVEQLFEDDRVDAVLCARGGFGAMRILPHIQWEVIRHHPKPFIGFSDATALLVSIIEKTGLPVIHGPTLLSLTHSRSSTIDAFINILSGPPAELVIDTAVSLIPGQCTGILKGGNLATLSHLVGTPFQPDFNGCLLFVEDIGEPAYKIDRMLSQMKLSGLFSGLKGVVAGEFVDCDNSDYIEEILTETFEEINIPVLSGLTSGHGSSNLPLYMGMPVEMDTSARMIKWI